MEFRKLNRPMLLILKAEGYNLLVSNQPLHDDVTIYWYPERVDDVFEFLIGLDISGAVSPLDEPNILVIEDALVCMEDEQLVGLVWMEF